MKMMSKEMANYRKGSGSKQCKNCDMFRDGTPNSCTLVKGAIDGRATCDHYESK